MGREAHREVRVGSRGPHRRPGGVVRPTQMSQRSLGALPLGRELSGVPGSGPEMLGKRT